MTVHYLFDIDGTLLRAGGAGLRALSAVMQTRYGVADGCRGLAAAGRTDPSIVAEIFVRNLGRDATPAEIDDVIALYLIELKDQLAGGGLRILPDAATVLSWLGARPDVRLAIATGNVRHGARLKLERADLANHFDLDTQGGFGCDSADRATLVARAVARAGVGDRDTVIVVGDTVHDVRAAQAVGATCVAVTTGGDTRETLEAAGASAVFDGLGAIPDWHTARFGA